MIKYNDEVIKQISLTNLAHTLGIKRNGNANWQCFNPEHKKQEKAPSLRITDGDGFYCYKSKCDIEGGNAVDLYMRYMNCDYPKALKGLSEMFNIAEIEFEEKETKTKKDSETLTKQADCLKYAKDFEAQKTDLAKKAKAELESRKISFEIAVKYRVGIMEDLFFPQINDYNKKNNTNLQANLSVITFPMYNAQKEFTGLRYRLFKADLEALPEEIEIRKSMNLKGSKLGLLFSCEGVEKSDVVLLCEGEIDGLSLASLGFSNVVMNLGGVGNCMPLIKELTAEKEVICFYDNDEAGKQAIAKLVSNGIPLKVVDLFEEDEEKQDINDLILMGLTKKDFEDFIAESKPFEFTDDQDEEKGEERIISKVFADGSMAELVYKPEEEEVEFIVFKNGKITNQKMIEFKGTTYFPLFCNKTSLLQNRNVLLPSKIENYSNTQELIDEIRAFIHKYVEVSDFFELISTYYVMFSWLYDKFSELPYLRVIADYGSGKTRYIQTIGALCYKTIFTGGASTSSPIFRMIEEIRGTLIFDEADFKQSDTTQEIIKILNSGYTRGFPVLRAEQKKSGSFDYKSFNVFSPKILATRKEFQDYALESRCITEEMEKCTRTDIKFNLTQKFWDEAEQIRNKLLFFRFTNFHNPIEEIKLNNLRIEPRIIQIMHPIVSIIEDKKFRDEVIESFVRYDQKLKEERQHSEAGEILQIVIELNDKQESFLIKEIAEAYNNKNGGYEKLTARKVGSILRQELRLKTHRTSEGYVLKIGFENHQRLEKLKHKFGHKKPQSSEGKEKISGEEVDKLMEEVFDKPESSQST